MSKLIDSVSELRGIDTWEGVAKSSLIVSALTQNFALPDIEVKLKELALENKLPLLSEFKERTASLAQIASYDGPEALHAFMDSAEYRPFFVEARDTLTLACDIAAEGDASKFASREVPIEDEFDLSAYLRSVAPPVSITQVVSLGAGLFSLSCFVIWFRNRKVMRDRRISKRIACEIPATLTVSGRSKSVMIVDISQAGANIHCNEKLPIDTVIELDFADLHRTATVKWSNDSFAGVLLNRLIGEARLAKIVARPASQMQRRKAS
ncbi:MAG: PilZ domain-containing protein [Pseudomonadota bacterium]